MEKNQAFHHYKVKINKLFLVTEEVEKRKFIKFSVSMFVFKELILKNFKE